MSELRSADEDSPLLYSVVLPVGLIAIWAVFCAALVHHGCFEIDDSVSQPVPTTPRADYCGSIDAVDPWLWLTLLPTVFMATLAWLNRKRWRLVALFAFMLALALIANAVLANSLNYTISFS